MKAIAAACSSVLLFGTASLFAQIPSQAPTPSPELKKQDFFVGDWTLEGTTRSSPFGPGALKFQSTEHLEWMPGGFFLLAYSYAGKKLAGIAVIEYDSKKNTFTHTRFNSLGGTEFWTGTADNDQWVWTRDAQVDSKPVRDRLTIKKTSANSYSFVDEVRPAEGGNWSIVAEGTGLRAD